MSLKMFYNSDIVPSLVELTNNVKTMATGANKEIEISFCILPYVFKTSSQSIALYIASKFYIQFEIPKYINALKDNMIHYVQDLDTNSAFGELFHH